MVVALMEGHNLLPIFDYYQWLVANVTVCRCGCISSVGWYVDIRNWKGSRRVTIENNMSHA